MSDEWPTKCRIREIEKKKKNKKDQAGLATLYFR